MGEKIATRVAYGKALVEFGEQYPNLVVLDADLSGSTQSGMFAKAFPDRFFNLGIAEQNMMGVAAGLAASGKQVFASSFAMFATGRCYEQIRTSIVFPKLNVKVVGSHGGLSVGEDGATHQCCEDIALMRTLPGMTVVCPADAFEMRLAVKALLDKPGPAYLRLARLATEVYTETLPGYQFELGKGTFLRPGKDVTIIATGMMVGMAWDAAQILAEQGIDARVIDIHTIKPLDEEMVVAAARETGCIVTSEEHSVVGGLGDAVCSLLAHTCPVPVIRHGVNDVFGRSGKAQDVLNYFGLNPQGIVEHAKKAMALKKG